jgi:hypothetical protein
MVKDIFVKVGLVWINWTPFSKNLVSGMSLCEGVHERENICPKAVYADNTKLFIAGGRT